MKKLILSIALLFTIFRSQADEGMWLPLLLGKQVYTDMVKKGLKLKADQLYSANKASIKDAIIIFGNGCTGEIVSSQGLIFLNRDDSLGQARDDCGRIAEAAAQIQHQFVRLDVKRVQQLGRVADAEMYKTFNMGMGFVVVVPPSAARIALDHLRGLVDYEVKVVGKVAKSHLPGFTGYAGVHDRLRTLAASIR